MRETNHILPPIFPYRYAIGAAAPFGISTPLSKLFLNQFQPVSLAAFLYLGCGIGISALFFARNAAPREKTKEITGPDRKDIPWLLGAIIAGGIFAPVLLFEGLSITTAATPSLLLNFEATATTIIAFFLFAEKMNEKSISALVFIALGGIILSLSGNTGTPLSLGAFAVIAACILWGFENNLTCRISTKDPLLITAVKGITAGTFLFLVSRIFNESLPSALIISGLMVLGFLCYGLSIFFFIKSLNIAGAARKSSMFATSPSIGVFGSWLIFPEKPGILFFATLIIMAAGTFLLFSEKEVTKNIRIP
ncbi:MAG: DMT family transporter [Methanomicrobiaceae archaeon]|nr:DMT family transporter [Methanomicrobiaceae archaeon]